jgi:hypothetical protein
MTQEQYDPRRERVTIERTPVEPVIPVNSTQPAGEVVGRRVSYAPSGVDMARRVVWLLFGILQGLLVLRILLLLLAANGGNDIVSLITGATDPFVEPFRGMFSLDRVDGAGGSTLDLAAVVALVGWTLVEALVLGIVSLVDRRPTAVA